MSSPLNRPFSSTTQFSPSRSYSCRSEPPARRSSRPQVRVLKHSPANTRSIAPPALAPGLHRRKRARVRHPASVDAHLRRLARGRTDSWARAACCSTIAAKRRRQAAGGSRLMIPTIPGISTALLALAAHSTRRNASAPASRCKACVDGLVRSLTVSHECAPPRTGGCACRGFSRVPVAGRSGKSR